MADTFHVDTNDPNAIVEAFEGKGGIKEQVLKEYGAFNEDTFLKYQANHDIPADLYSYYDLATHNVSKPEAGETKEPVGEKSDKHNNEHFHLAHNEKVEGAQNASGEPGQPNEQSEAKNSAQEASSAESSSSKLRTAGRIAANVWLPGSTFAYDRLKKVATKTNAEVQQPETQQETKPEPQPEPQTPLKTQQEIALESAEPVWRKEQRKKEEASQVDTEREKYEAERNAQKQPASAKKSRLTTAGKIAANVMFPGSTFAVNLAAKGLKKVNMPQVNPKVTKGIVTGAKVAGAIYNPFLIPVYLRAKNNRQKKIVQESHEAAWVREKRKLEEAKKIDVERQQWEAKHAVQKGTNSSSSKLKTAGKIGANILFPGSTFAFNRAKKVNIPKVNINPKVTKGIVTGAKVAGAIYNPFSLPFYLRNKDNRKAVQTFTRRYVAPRIPSAFNGRITSGIDRINAFSSRVNPYMHPGRMARNWAKNQLLNSKAGKWARNKIANSFLKNLTKQAVKQALLTFLKTPPGWITVGVILIIFLIPGTIAYYLAGGRASQQSLGGQIIKGPLTVTISGPSLPVDYGTDLTYTITVIYTGQGNADVTLTSPIPYPNSMSFKSATAGGKNDNNVITWSLKAVQANTPKTVSFVLHLHKHPTDNFTQIDSTATAVLGVTSGGGGPPIGNLPPNHSTCNGKYSLTCSDGPNPKGNFGDPACTASEDKILGLLKQTDPTRLTLWKHIVYHESGYSPNACLIHSTSGLGAWGLFQLNPNGANGPHDKGDVDWRMQIYNATQQLQDMAKQTNTKPECFLANGWCVDLRTDGVLPSGCSCPF